jgi:hypothetical protein
LRNQTGGAVNSWSSAVSSGATTATVTAFANLQANAVYNLVALSGSQISLPISVTLTGGVGPIPAPVPLAGDIDGNGQVNSLDWSIMSTRWFTADAAADLNHDGIVNSIDFSILNNNWFRTVP